MFKQQNSDRPNGHKDNLFTPSTGMGSTTGSSAAG